ncbi:hypothetical protein FM042_11640 [Aliidiomarina halalkaliphila]|uniref:Uncharacterized protein n=1 Tax=Aliidiomarina halalkaliphila TaxID=2593535 RepID=A0A552WYV9_9GAMM|nr:hypothetical protein [Aliidiomarina halalkaliphila]TRW47977.1 hypothetical protein FM042_11640 [Aliidiomarina halalkaliphila]
MSLKQYERRNEHHLARGYFERVLAELVSSPEKMMIVRSNVDTYSQHQHLPKSAQAALRRFQHFFAVSEDPTELQRWVLEDSYEGRRFRQFPLLFKGVLPSA